jgi:flagellar hook protein FlgE
MMAQTLRGAGRPTEGGIGGTNPMQVGLGTQVSSIDTLLEQGVLQSTNRVLDLAIQGNGFFVVSDGRRIAFTRDGSFDIDANGSLVHKGTGQRVVGWMPDASGNIDTTRPPSASSGIAVPIGRTVAGRATSEVLFRGNLALDGTSWTTTVTIYDALGEPHALQLDFARRQGSEWRVTGTVTGWDTVPRDLTIQFDGQGRINSGASQTITIRRQSGARDEMDIRLDFSRLTQFATSSNVEPLSQNGYPPGTLEQLTVSPDGTINGVFSNGLNLPVARLAMAVFNNPGGLERTGNNLFRESINSGIANIGTAQTGGRGSISSGYLEMSNADIGNEFTNLIITQRGFQANTRIVSTVDEMLQDVLQMKR